MTLILDQSRGTSPARSRRLRDFPLGILGLKDDRLTVLDGAESIEAGWVIRFEVVDIDLEVRSPDESGCMQKGQSVLGTIMGSQLTIEEVGVPIIESKQCHGVHHGSRPAEKKHGRPFSTYRVGDGTVLFERNLSPGKIFRRALESGATL